MIGITSYGAYVPMYRMSLQTLAQTWGGFGGKGEKAVANWDEDNLTMATESAIDCLNGMDRSLVECHDCFSISEIIAVESMGLCERGKGKEDLDAGAWTQEGEIPVNLSGGLKPSVIPLVPVGAGRLLRYTNNCKEKQRMNPVN